MIFLYNIVLVSNNKTTDSTSMAYLMRPGAKFQLSLLNSAKYEIQILQLVAQHCFVASFGRCFPFFTLRDQPVAYQKHCGLRVEESCSEK